MSHGRRLELVFDAPIDEHQVSVPVAAQVVQQLRIDVQVDTHTHGFCKSVCIPDERRVK